jgi:hypothetical protein
VVGSAGGVGAGIAVAVETGRAVGLGLAGGELSTPEQARETAKKRIRLDKNLRLRVISYSKSTEQKFDLE